MGGSRLGSGDSKVKLFRKDLQRPNANGACPPLPFFVRAMDVGGFVLFIF